MIYAGARAKGDEMADAAKEDGESVQGQVDAAAEGAMDSMNDENAKISDVVSAAYKSAKETGLEEGMTEPAAQTAAVEAIKDELEKSGMSNAEVWKLRNAEDQTCNCGYNCPNAPHESVRKHFLFYNLFY